MAPFVKADDFTEVKEELDLEVEMQTVVAEKIEDVEQDAFMQKVERFCRKNNLEFKIPKFYGEDLDLLKLWREVINLGGYDEVCAKKLWKQVGRTFDPPKTCTSLSFTFRQFYAKALLEYERGQFEVATFGDLSRSPHQTAACEIKGTRRFREDSAARTETGRIRSGHNPSENSDTFPFVSRIETRTVKSDYEDKDEQRQLENSDSEAEQEGCPAGSPDRSLIRRDFTLYWRNMKASSDQRIQSRETTSPKRSSAIKKMSDIETQTKPWSFMDSQRVEHIDNIGLSTREKLNIVVADEGSPAEWVKINAYKVKDVFEIYALVPGLTPKELRVDCEVSGRVVITGFPPEKRNLWGLTNFRKVFHLPSNIDPFKFEASLSISGQLLLRVPILLGMKSAKLNLQIIACSKDGVKSE